MKSDVRILVVDDSQTQREFVVQALASREDFVTLEASDGTEGLEMALTDSPDLILLDLEMPYLDGFQVMDTLREQQANIPVILLASRGSEAIAVESFRKGAKDYLIKPFTVKEMQTAIERALTEVSVGQEREILTEQLECRLRELHTLYQVGKWVTSLLPRDQVLERILDVVFHVLGAEEATLMLVDRESGQLRTQLHRQWVPGELQRMSRRSTEELAAEAARKGDATATGAILCAPLRVGNRIIGALGVGNRVSAQPFSQHDHQLLMAMVDYAAIAIENARLYDEVRQADRAKSEFVSWVAHELSTPMTSISGYTEMLVEGTAGPLTAQQEQFVRNVHSNVGRMQVLVSDLQDISRIETGQLRLAMKPAALADALKNALQSTQTQIEARSQQLTVEVPGNLPLVRADPARMTQILINLLSNAYKYTPDGGHIRVQAQLQNVYVHCAVSDTGIGISPEDQARLFTKFFRSEESTVRETPGTGLGLCIAKSLVELQGGEIEVESQIGKGTTVTFTIPIAVRGVMAW